MLAGTDSRIDWGEGGLNPMTVILYILMVALGVTAGHDIAVNRAPLVIVVGEDGHIVSEKRVKAPVIILKGRDGEVEVRHQKRGDKF